ncbi:hypothetical protein DPMN_116476 [Dreissena polymorpha]|uniref:Uncharacterized protein n=1 Tax=Dreissena polymorpha TaxID=45954 RepID=A0A9D4QUS2_DREPO|nr:hypothetical protein DPMN_116476 [Dreissena polymorpha]
MDIVRRINVYILFLQVVAQDMHYGTRILFCTDITFSTHGPIVFMNKDFPRQSLIKSCSCQFSSNNTLLRLIHGDIRHPNNDSSGNLIYINNSHSYNLSAKVDNIINFSQLDDVKTINISITNSASLSNVSFVLIISASFDSEVIVHCLASDSDKSHTAASDRPTSTHSFTTAPQEEFDSLTKSSSPILVLILGCLCAAFLLIILMVSIMLCCVMPRKQKARLSKIRQSMADEMDAGRAHLYNNSVDRIALSSQDNQPDLSKDTTARGIQKSSAEGRQGDINAQLEAPSRDSVSSGFSFSSFDVRASTLYSNV